MNRKKLFKLIFLILVFVCFVFNGTILNIKVEKSIKAKKFELIGDLDDDELVNTSDVIYLLMHTYFTDKYPVTQNCDYNQDGVVDTSDVIYLLMHTYFPQNYPLEDEIIEDVEVNINFNTLGGTINEDIIVKSDGEIVLPTPKLSGYIFKYWCTDRLLTNRVNNLMIDDCQGQTLYAYYEYDSEDLKSQVIVTRYNEHAASYNEMVMFDNSKSNFTSLYWHKIAIRNNGTDYYISAIASSGESLNTLGDYDYVVMAHSNYSGYGDFVKGNYEVGDIVKFIGNPDTLINGEETVIMSFIKQSIADKTEEIQEYLDSLYGNITEVTSNLDLISNYNQYNIIWKTSNREVISSKGKYTKPYVTREVTLRAFIDDVELYRFMVKVPGIKDTSEALATGYIYTPYTITQNAMNTLDIIYCAFLEIDENANWTNYNQMVSNINNYIRDKANVAGTKIVISVNQSTNSAFSIVAGNEKLRKVLATNIVNVIETLNLDGIDIDWETPSSDEATNFTLLMAEIFKQVKAASPEYLVTAAIGGGKWQPPKYDLTNSGKYLDYINLMTYSLAKGNGYYQNSLYKSTKGATLTSCSIDESIDIFNNLGIKNSQILVGIPFYMIVQTDSDGPGSKTGTGKSVWYDKLYSTYALSDTMKEYYDEECSVPYRFDDVNKIFISFDNEQSIKEKCEYINTLGLAGIMYWQYGQDVDDILSDAIDEYINK